MDDDDDSEHELELLQDFFGGSDVVRDAAAEKAAQDSEADRLFAEIAGASAAQQGLSSHDDLAALNQESLALTHWFGDPKCLTDLGTTVQKGMYSKYLRFSRKNESLPLAVVDESSLEPGTRKGLMSNMTSHVVKNFVQDTTIKSVAVVAELSGRSKKHVGLGLQRVGCAMLYGAGWMVGSSLLTWRKLFRGDRFRPIAVIDKMLYDETPLKMKLQEYNQFLSRSEQFGLNQSCMQESYTFAKILRLDWQLAFLVHDKYLDRRKLVSVKIPTPLLATDRNTSECLVGVIDAAHSLIPGLNDFAADFQHHVRFPIIDRFSANMKAENFMACRHGNVVTTPFTCDVHKASSSIKSALSLTDDTLSGIVNLALALEGSGSLDQLRKITQQIFAEELQVVFSQPLGPGTEEFAHRQAVLDAFLPLDGDGPNLQTRRRRFVLQSLGNSNIAHHEIIHHCSFSCCRSPEETLPNFQKWMTWALLPAKLGTFNRKSWTGADVAVHWRGLLHSHWFLLSRVMLRFVTVDRPILSERNKPDYDNANALAGHEDDAKQIESCLAFSLLYVP